MASGFYMVKRPWTKQPPLGTPLDKTHPAFDKMVLAYGFNEGGDMPLDLVGAQGAGRPNGNIGLTESPTPMVGRYWAINEGGHAWDWDAALGEGDPTFSLDYMVESRFEFKGGDGYSRLLVAKINPVGINPGLWRSGPTGQGDTWDIIESTTDYTMFQVSGTEVWAVADAIPMSRNHGTHLLTFEDGGTTSIYENGSLLATKASPATSFAQDRIHALNGQFSEDRGFNGTWNFLIIWRRGLENYLAQSLSDNPWQVFQPRTMLLPMDVAAGGGGAGRGCNPGMSGGMLPLEGGMQG